MVTPTASPPSQRALDVCAEPGCPTLIRRGDVRCAQHGGRDGGYTRAEWRRVARAQLEREPRCAQCRRAAQVVHHRDDQGLRGARRHDPTNLASLCRACHARLHRGGRGPAALIASSAVSTAPRRKLGVEAG
jgi:hypothetical protein